MLRMLLKCSLSNIIYASIIRLQIDDSLPLLVPPPTSRIKIVGDDTNDGLRALPGNPILSVLA